MVMCTCTRAVASAPDTCLTMDLELNFLTLAIVPRLATVRSMILAIVYRCMTHSKNTLHIKFSGC